MEEEKQKKRGRKLKLFRDQEYVYRKENNFNGKNTVENESNLLEEKEGDKTQEKNIIHEFWTMIIERKKIIIMAISKEKRTYKLCLIIKKRREKE